MPNKMCITVYPKKYAHGFCFAVLCCGYTLTDFPISTRLTLLALWQSKDCPSAGKATLMNMDKYFMWNHYERLHNHNKAKHKKTMYIFLGIYCTCLHSVSITNGGRGGWGDITWVSYVYWVSTRWTLGEYWQLCLRRCALGESCTCVKMCTWWALDLDIL